MNNTLSKGTVMDKVCISILTIGIGILLGYLFFTNSILLMVALLCIGYFAVKSVRVALFLFIFSIPFNMFISVQSIFPLKLTYIFFLILVFSFIYSYTPSKKEELFQKIKTPIDSLLFVALLLIIISVFQSRFIPDNPYIIQNTLRNYPWIKSITKILPLLFCISAFYLCTFLLNSKEKIKEILAVYTSATVLASIIGVVAYILYVFFGYFTRINSAALIVAVPGDVPRLVGTEAEPLFFGLYLLTILPVLYALLFTQYLSKEKKKMYPTKWVFLIVGVITLALLLTGSRSAVLGFLVSLIILFFLYKEERSYKQYCKDIFYSAKEWVQNFYGVLTRSRQIKIITVVCLVFLVTYGIIYIN